MKTYELNGIWRMRGAGFDVNGQIPGSVYSFLLAERLMPDPFYRDNELQCRELMENDFTFSRKFCVQKRGYPFLLRCEGLDTVCEVRINGQTVAHTQNMHRTYEWDVTALLTDGENEIEITCFSAIDYLRQKQRIQKLRCASDGIHGYPHIRKAYYMLGWDWGPILPDAGIWRDIRLIETEDARIEDLRIDQRHADGRVYLKATASLTKDVPVFVTLTAPSGETTTLENGVETEVSDPQLWWCNGLGEQPLYTVTAAIDGDSTSRRIGLRTIRLIRERDEFGEGFYHELNGQAVFAMGADYIPEDNILSRITPETTRKLLQAGKDCNFNAIRVWGGGYYPDDWFFDLCDEMGLLVFNDMMVACGLPSDTEEMRREFAAEFRDNLLRFRHHPCLALLCGNNEVEQNYWDKPMDALKESYFQVFEKILPDLVQELCPELPYVPSSPSTCGHFCDPLNEDFGDSHYWKVWHHDLPYEEYRKHYFRYLSEFGFQSFPLLKTVDRFTLPEDRNIFSRIMERHQRSDGSNGKILSYIARTFLYPSSFEKLLFASQLTQLTAIRSGVEHLRRNRGRCMGALYWQFNDVWYGASWSSIDYAGRYKALQYGAKRFFAPVMLSCAEIGETHTRASVNMLVEDYDYETSAVLCVTNDTREPVAGTVRWSLRRPDSTVLLHGQNAVTVPPFSAFSLPKMDFDKTDVERNHLWYELETADGVISRGSALFTAPKHYLFNDPHLTVERHGGTLTLHSDAFAQFVWIDSPDGDLLLSDNAFDMEAGERTVQILAGDAERLTVTSVFDIR